MTTPTLPTMPPGFLDELKQLNIEIKHDGERWRFYHGDRPLRAIWNTEAAADLRHFHGLDAEAEIASCVLDQIRYELAAAKASDRS